MEGEQISYIDPHLLGKERLDEIEKLSNELKSDKKNKVSHSFQKLPFFLRRRNMSKNPKRIPKRYRPQTTTPKRPTRVKRRRPSLFHLYSERIKKPNFVFETHIWHAKRCHMEFLFGMKLPVKRVEKTFRRNFRQAFTKENNKDGLAIDTSFYDYVVTTNTNRDLFKNFCEVYELNTEQCVIKTNRMVTDAVFKITNKENSFCLKNLISTYKIIGEEGLERLSYFFQSEAAIEAVKRNKNNLLGFSFNYADFKAKKQNYLKLESKCSLFTEGKDFLERVVESYENVNENLRKIPIAVFYEDSEIDIFIPSNFGKTFWLSINHSFLPYGCLSDLYYIYSLKNKSLFPFDFLDEEYVRKQIETFSFEKISKRKNREKFKTKHVSKLQNIASIESLVENKNYFKRVFITNRRPLEGGILYAVDKNLFPESKIVSYEEIKKHLQNPCGFIYYDNYSLLRGEAYGLGYILNYDSTLKTIFFANKNCNCWIYKANCEFLD